VADVQETTAPPSTSTSLTRRWGVTTRLPPRRVGRRPRLPRRDARGRPQGRYPPLRSRPRSRRQRRGVGSGLDPQCRQTPPTLVPTSIPSTLKMTRATCNHRRQQWLRHRESRRRRRPARSRWRGGELRRAPTQRMMLGRTKDEEGPTQALLFKPNLRSATK
jgi:hypothetical protein